MVGTIGERSQWIAWDRRQTKIVASGRTFAEAKERAVAAGELDPVMAKAPKRFSANRYPR